MTVADADWWRARLTDEEDVLWSGRPDQGFFPLQYGWVYKVFLLALAVLWLVSPWMLESVREFWKLTSVTLLLTFTLWADQFVRSQRVYVVTSQDAWTLNKKLKSKALKIDRFLSFTTGRRAVVFNRHPFFRFDHLSDPSAAFSALLQAQEASK
ncbi:hypothetical protein RUE5091_02115 [Ruegeria denitrificans]|uniref:Uncharacterized protein n=1 Tax=Ruegeria denitrificans TaxID=1715692 RepID=A0A0P1IGZ4_9RHOB|nr:hypothetical protein [Ruegeria denitrificans]CUK00319.1 hypothetical protein RUE5091_02115 [Ruegeria denitrificans]